MLRPIVKKTGYIIISLYFLGLFLPSYSLNTREFEEVSNQVIIDSEPPYLHQGEEWADSILSKMDLRQKIGQLFMVAAYSNKNKRHNQKINGLIKDYGIGGLIFFQGGPVRQARLTNDYQKKARIPLLIAMDAEWGIGMRLDSVMDFPRQLTLGAVRNNNLIYKMGEAIAEQCQRLGVHINFAPVVDVNSNPLNPVINDRSFGEDMYNVSNKGIAYMKGLQDNKVLACAKHFPGHGDTDKDSHKTLPSVAQDYTRIDSLELYPFKQLIESGVGSIMNAHLYVPALDSLEKRASSLSKKICTDLLKGELDFKGLSFTDALNMKGVSQYFKPGQLELKAYKAGNDILLFPEDVPKAIRVLEKAFKNGELALNELDSRVRKILQLKYWAGLNKKQKVEEENINEDLNSIKHKILDYHLREASLTLVANHRDLIPIKNLRKVKLATLSIGSSDINTFQKTVDQYKKADHFFISKQATPEEFRLLLTKLKRYSHVMLTFHKMNKSALKDYGIGFSSLGFLKKLQSHTNVITVLFGSPYSLSYFNDATHLLLAYEDTKTTQTLTAQALFGGVRTHGTLPVTASHIFPMQKGYISYPPFRMKYTFPEYAGMSSEKLESIDSIALDAISDKATPGCQILVCKNGNVIYQKSFGYHTYEKNKEVNNEDVYDLASITKVAATTLALMKLYDQKKIQLDSTLKHYLPEVRGTNKENMTLKDLLLHQAGLKGWIPFYVNAIQAGKDSLFSKSYNDTFDIRVADDFFMRTAYESEIWTAILESDVELPAKYRYSDLGFYFFKKIVESVGGMSLDLYLKKHFYDPMGLTKTTYNPLDYQPIDHLVPTEDDKVFRNQVVHGYVHDPGAAMLGGVGGHAGLFSNSREIAVIGQMLMNGGEYGGKKYLKSATIETFISKHKKGNRRGLGFDKPTLSDSGPASKYASYKTFGHTGFTGTCFWVDPKYQIVYVFLSNRVYPTASHNKLAKNNIRTKIQDIIYESIEN